MVMLVLNLFSVSPSTSLSGVLFRCPVCLLDPMGMRWEGDRGGRLISSVVAVISQGINAGDVKKLQDAGIYTCNGLMMQTKKVTGIWNLLIRMIEVFVGTPS